MLPCKLEIYSLSNIRIFSLKCPKSKALNDFLQTNANYTQWLDFEFIQLLEYKAKTTHTTMSIGFKIETSMNEFWTLLTLWYALFLPCTPEYIIFQGDPKTMSLVKILRLFCAVILLEKWKLPETTRRYFWITPQPTFRHLSFLNIFYEKLVKILIISI
jgi:hypothetical protein